MNASKQRIKHHLENIAQYTATPGQGTTRLSYSEEDRQTRTYLKEQMQSIGLTVREDAIGNIFGRLNGAKDDLPTVMIGSHFDSVPNGGMFDGPAGVVMGLEIATLFHLQKLTPYYPLEIVALVEEEGTSFGSGLLASRTIAGHITSDMLQKLTDCQGVSAAEKMAQAGFNADNVASAIRTPSSIKAFIELHIEQGPVLEQTGVDIGIVDVIVGICQLIVTVKGKAGHAGTTPMNMRSDALVTTATIVNQINQLALKMNGQCVATVGKLQVFPNGANVIPDKVIFSVDIRAKHSETLKQLVTQIKQTITHQANENIECKIDTPISIQPVELDHNISIQLQENSRRLGFSYQTMVSGAGHDAMIFAEIAPVGLVFVPSKNGLSHHPDEWTDYHQIQKGVEVIFETVKQLTKVELYD